jgi:pimeloyl-ACP methyl ester carboxylesterase
VPALIVWGMEDPYFSLSFLDDLARWFTQSLRVVTVPKAGHWVFQDAAITVNRELRSWLENLG